MYIHSINVQELFWYLHHFFGVCPNSDYFSTLATTFTNTHLYTIHTYIFASHILPQNRLSPRFIDKAKQPNRLKVKRETSYKADQGETTKYRNLPPVTLEQN